MRATLKSAIGAMFDPRGTTRAAKSTLAIAEHLKPLFQSLKIDLVVDIGADQGQFADLLRQSIDYGGRIASFEAIPSRFAALQKNAARDGLWHLEHASFGAAGGDLKLNVIDLKAFRGNEPQPRGSNQSAPRIAQIRRETVPIRTLDDTITEQQARYGAKRIFVNLASSSQDQDILKGAEHSLGQIAAILTDLHTSRKSEGMPHHLATLSYFEAKHFTPRFFVATSPTAFACCMVNAAGA